MTKVITKDKDIAQVLLLALRSKAGEEELYKKMASLEDEDWQALFSLSIKNGLFPQLYDRLARLNLKKRPPEFSSKFRNIYLLNLKRNMLFEREMLKILDYLKEAGMRVIPLKGPFLARYIYNDLALRRSSGDLDILVRYDEIEKIGNKLKDIGYSFCSGRFEIDIFHRFRRQISLQKRSAREFGVVIELQWDIRDMFTRTHTEEFWANSKEVDFNGHRVLAPSDEDLVLYLVLKSTFVFDSNFVEIKYLYDMHSLITSAARHIDWEMVARKVDELGLGVDFFYAFSISRAFFNTDIPEDILERFRPSPLKRLLVARRVRKEKILQAENKIPSTYVWYFLTSSFLRSKTIFGCLRMVLRKIRIAVELIMCTFKKESLPCQNM